MPRKRVRAPVTEEVAAAIHDILHGVSVDSHTEWLQREYVRLMRREAQVKNEAAKARKDLGPASSVKDSPPPAK